MELPQTCIVAAPYDGCSTVQMWHLTHCRLRQMSAERLGHASRHLQGLALFEETITAPLSMRVLDAACGSGTFLFHAVRKYIVAAEAESQPLPDILEGVTKHVYGMDLHPVAVTLARVTYLLALGRARLTDPSRRSIQIPVFLGDSIQW